ncbi:MAG TPA: homoserine dehydrogenase [Thermoanaerobaculia bacterium]|nr:homoserine dehydrogenase [Thermoanaerobaculia bacterium]
MSASEGRALRPVPVFLLGAGGVGRELVRQIVAGRETAAARAGCRFEVVGIADRRGVRLAADGIPDATLLAAIAGKANGEPIGPAWEGTPDAASALIGELVVAGHRQGVLVDTTAAAGWEPLLDRCLDLGWAVALANKKALAGPWATARRYFHHPRVRHESTVGGGQPVIATMRSLVDTDDPPREVSGALSGTLGYLCLRMEEGVAFSAAVREAAARGYTEPDPREDLGGRDVVRKLLILGRLAGWEMEEGDIEVEELYPPELAALPVPDFLAALPRLDDAFAARVAAARAAGGRLRYVGRAAAGRGRAGLETVPAASPLANLKHVALRTARYDDEPLVIGGKGAGVEMTAAGVLADLFSLAREIAR